jgi:hypothetical protein
MDHCIEEAFASALGVLAITRIFFDNWLQVLRIGLTS